MKTNIVNLRPAGYRYLLERFEIEGMPNWHTSSVSTTGTHYTTVLNGVTEEVFRSQYWPGENAADHLEFAIKYDGINLGLLKIIFDQISQNEIVNYIQSKPTGKYSRKLWFLYEFLTGIILPIDNITSGNYVNLLEIEKYYTVTPGLKSRRYRIVNNLLGSKEFCPIIRKTEKLSGVESSILRKKCEDIITYYPPELLSRALGYLYNKETKSSFEIEHVKPDTARTQKFIALLKLAEREDFCNKDQLIKLQNLIVDPRFKDSNYRINQNYVGQTIAYQEEIIYFVGPKPNDLPHLMHGLINSHKQMEKGKVAAIIHATAISYGFVFLHPFEDGNGRIHRFLIHNIMATRGMVPTGLMFPISAVMLKDKAIYNTSLESFSKPLLQLINFRLDKTGQMTVTNETSNWYKYMDLTAQAEALYKFVNKTIKKELSNELNFLANYDSTKNAIQNIIDMPDRLIDLFIQLCIQNNGTLSSRKRSSYFNFLTDQELIAMTDAVKIKYNNNS